MKIQIISKKQSKTLCAHKGQTMYSDFSYVAFFQTILHLVPTSFSPAIKILFLRSLAAQSTFALYTCKMKTFCEIRSIMLEFIWGGIKWRK